MTPTQKPRLPKEGNAARNIVFTPSETATVGKQYLEWRENNKHLGVPMYIASVDEYYLPLMAPEMEGLVAVSSHGKTALLNWRARNRALELAKKGITNRAVVQVSWEDTVEEMYAFHLAASKGIPVNRMARGNLSRADWNAVTEYSIQRMGLPLWIIGPSMMRDQDPGDITIEILEEALGFIQRWEGQGGEKIEIDVIIGDYLQVTPVADNWTKGGSSTSYTLGLNQNARTFKKLGRTFGCGTVMGAQAKQDVEERKNPVPQVNDTEWLNGFRQICNRMTSLCYPIKHVAEGKKFLSVDNIKPDDFIISILKQKLDQAGIMCWTKFYPALNKFGSADLLHFDLTNV